jgi:hypothetical protein
MSNKIFGINSQSKYEIRGGFWLGTDMRNTAGHFTPGAIEGSHVAATKQYRRRAVMPMH